MTPEQRLLVGTHAQGLGAMYQVLDRLALNFEMEGNRHAAQEVREVCAHVNLGVVRLEALLEGGPNDQAPANVPR